MADSQQVNRTQTSAAVVTGAVAVAMACTPVLGAGGIPDHG